METPTPPPARRMGHSLAIVPFRNVFAAASVSALGAAISAVSVSWVVYHYTHSAIDIAYVGLVGVIPGIVLGLFAGVVADRYNRRSIMVASDLARMAGIGLLAAFLFLVGFSLPLILGVMLVVYSFSAMFTPASQAILPSFVPMDSLEDANGLLQASTAVMNSVGAAAGGIAVVLVGAAWGLGINALTYALSASFLIRVAADWGRPRVEPSTAPRSGLRDAAEGFRYMRAHRPLLETVLLSLPINFLACLALPFLVVYASIRFGGNPEVYGYLVATSAAGTALGALSVGRIRARRFVGVLIAVCILGLAGFVAVLALTHGLAIALAASVGIGVMVGLINTAFVSLVQAIVPREILARVLSIDSVGSTISIPAGLLVGGVLIGRYGIEFGFLVAAVGLAANGAAAIALKEFRSLRYGSAEA